MVLENRALCTTGWAETQVRVYVGMSVVESIQVRMGVRTDSPQPMAVLSVLPEAHFTRGHGHVRDCCTAAQRRWEVTEQQKN